MIDTRPWHIGGSPIMGEHAERLLPAGIQTRLLPLDEVGGRLIGKLGRVSGRIGPGLVGEIMVAVRGGVEAFYAHPQRADEVIEPGVQVLIVDFQPPRTAYVERWDTGG
ncbi:hypothetical protein GCM10009609_25750 [Pseudonocardia aurantiaca]